MDWNSNYGNKEFVRLMASNHDNRNLAIVIVLIVVALWFFGCNGGSSSGGETVDPVPDTNPPVVVDPPTPTPEPDNSNGLSAAQYGTAMIDLDIELTDRVHVEGIYIQFSDLENYVSMYDSNKVSIVDNGATTKMISDIETVLESLGYVYYRNY